MADHGYYLYQISDLYHNAKGRSQDIGNYFPLLMVKDFGSKGFTISDEFMTNADTPVLAVEGLIADPVNPFTGKRIDSSEKTAHPQFILTSRDWSVDSNDGNAFKAGTWAVVRSNIWNRSDWEFITEEVVLTEHRIP